MPDVLLGSLKAGLQANGGVLDDLNWASFHIADQLGIEPIIGVSGFRNKTDFMGKIRELVGSRMADWRPCQLDLFRCWFANLDDFSYAGWRTSPDADAAKVVKVRIFALRHKAWPLLQTRRVKAFHCERQRSYAVASWAKTNPGEPLSPNVMRGFTDVGFYLTGIVAGDSAETRLTWPTADLQSALSSAVQLAGQGVRQIHLFEGGMGFSLDDCAPSDTANLLRQYQYFGEEVALPDLASSVGLI